MTVTFSTNETIINWTSSDDPAVTFQVVKIAGGTGGGGGGAPDPHASTHAAAGSDPVALSGTQITSGIIAPARLGTGTADAYHFLDGSGTWNDDVPVLVPCKNTTASTIAKGAPVYVTGTVGATSVVEIAPADADNAATMPAIGLLNSELTANATGYVVVVGSLKGLNTNSYSINQAVYVSTTAGTLTGTKPTGETELIQNIGRVTRVNTNSGEILVLGPGRTNDVPNAIAAEKLTSGTVAYARLPVGTTSSTVAAGDDSRITGAAQKASNLSDLANFGTARANLGVISNGGGFLYTGNASGLLIENINPTVTNVGTALTLTSGRVVLVPIYLPGGLTITNLSFCSHSTAASSPTNQWYVLCDSSRAALRFTVNDTTTAWASQTVKTLALTSTYTTTTSGYYYVGVMVSATTPPTIRSTTGTANGLLTDVRNSDTGLTTPPSLPNTFGAGAMLSSYPWVGVS